MKKSWLKTFLVCSVVFPTSAHAIPRVTVGSNNQTITVGTGETISASSTSGGLAPILNNGGYLGTQITVDTGDTTKGLISFGGAGSAVSFLSAAAFENLTISSGLVTSDVTAGGSTVAFGSTGSETKITVGQNSGNSAILSNSADGAVISTSGNNLSFAIDNKATGEISSTSGNVFNFSDSDGGSSVTLSNAGTITAGTNKDVFHLTGYAVTLQDSNDGTITGNVSLNTASSLTLSSGAIFGDVSINSASSLILNTGSIIGNITSDSTSSVIFRGDYSNALIGTIDGGNVKISADTSIGYDLGSTTALTSLEIDADKTLEASYYNVAVNATNLTLNSGSSLSINPGKLSGSVDGAEENQGTLFLLSNGTSSEDITASIGSTKDVGLVRVVGNGFDINLNESVKAQTVEIADSGARFTLKMAADKSIDGAVSISEGDTLQFSSGSSVTGAITGAVSGMGIVSIADGVSTTALNDFGTEDFFLSALSLGDTIGSSLDMGDGFDIHVDNITLHSGSSITSSGIITNGSFSLESGSALNLNDGAFLRSYMIDGGSAGTGAINTNGLVVVLGPIGTTNSISEITVNNGSQGRFGNIDDSGANTINASNINVFGQFDLLDATTITGNVTMSGSNAKLNTSGYSQTINGDFTTSSGSMIIAGVHTASSADTITVTGAAMIDSNTKLYLSFANSGTTAVGSSYVIVQGGAGSSISAVSDSNILVEGVATNKYGNYLFKTSVSGDNLLLLVSSSFVASPTNSQVYDLVSNDTSTSGALYNLRQYLNNSTSDEAKDAAIASVKPQVDNANNRVGFNSAGASLDVASSRLSSLSSYARLKTPVQIASNNLSGLFDANPISKSVWGQAFGSKISQGNNGSYEGYSASLKGFAFGVDKEVVEDSYLGLSLSYANSTVTSRTALKRTTINAYQLNAYHGVDFDNFFLRNLVGFVWNDYKTNRQIPSAGVRAEANFAGQTYIARSEIGTNAKLQNNFVLSPSFMVTAAHNTLQDYSESGAGSLSLAVRNNSSNFFELRGGTSLSNKFCFKDHVVIPEISASYGYDLAHSRQKTSANFVGQTSSFDSTGANIARGSVKLGTGARVYGSEDLFFDANYTFEHRQNFVANSLALKATRKF